jgi:hypothetical protein
VETRANQPAFETGGVERATIFWVPGPESPEREPTRAAKISSGIPFASSMRTSRFGEW